MPVLGCQIDLGLTAALLRLPIITPSFRTSPVCHILDGGPAIGATLTPRHTHARTRSRARTVALRTVNDARLADFAVVVDDKMRILEKAIAKVKAERLALQQQQ